MAWTAEQESAINARGCSVLVSAAAGSGKTSVLVERLIRILSDSVNRVPADRMAVVTFTKDAAAEMKQRLSAALADLTEREPENQWLSEQQLLLQSAKISTIHSFCFDLIRDNIHELELAGSFRIMDETEANLMVSGVIKEIIDSRYDTHPEMMELLYDQFCEKNDSGIEEILKSIYEFICSLPFGISWLGKVTEGYSPSGNILEAFQKEYMKYITAEIHKAAEMSDECIQLALEGDAGEKASDLLQTENDAFRKIKSLFASADKTPAEKLAEYAEPGFGRLTFAKNADPENKKKIQTLRDEYKDVIKKKLSQKTGILQHSEEDISMHYRVLSAFLELVTELDEKLWKKKTEKNCIGFADAEMLAVKLLARRGEDGSIHKTQLADDLSEYYQIIMIDEFQDTNNNQDLIFRMLSKGGSAERPGSNLFMVGDVKQSIYRFRLANPKNFISTMDNSVEYTENNSGENSFIRLNRNFRSSADVINLVNFVFRTVMSREVGEIVYDSGEELVQGAVFSDRDRKTEVALIDSEAENAPSQAEYTAEKIASMLREGTPVDNRDGTTRPCQMKDFCILLRSRKHAQEYKTELAKRGINAYSEETAGYLSSREISVLLNLLRVTDNPLIDTSFAAVLLSPLFMFTDDEMIILRLEKRKGHLYNAVYAAAEGESTVEMPDALKAKSIHVIETMSDLRMHAASKSLVELIQYIYERTDFISLVHMYEDGAGKRANLRALLEYAKTYQQSSDAGLNGFIRYIDRTLMLKGDFKPGQTAATSENAVSIKTIHKSKGLEFPFVFLCETQTRFNRQDSLKKYQFSYESGIGFKLQSRREFMKYTTLPYEVINGMNMGDSLSEEMRLLYVALTRARERLFIPLDTGKAESKLGKYAQKIHQNQGVTPGLSRSADSMADWLLMAFITHRNGNPLRVMSGYDMFWIQDSGFEIDFTEVTEKSGDGCNSLSVQASAEPDPKLTDEIRRRFEASRCGDGGRLQAKFSVSDITKDHSKFGITLKRPSFMKEQTGMTPSERGTVIHSILQHADFENLRKNPEEEIQRAADNGFITQSQADQTDVRYLKAFTDSDIFRRAAASSRMERERKFLVRISDLELENEYFRKFSGTDCMVQGIIDMYFEEDDGLVLVDYKTDNVSDMNTLVENYGLQLELYRGALEKTENKKVKQTVIYSLWLSQTAEI